MAFVSDAAANTVRSGCSRDASGATEAIGGRGGHDAAGDGDCASAGDTMTDRARRTTANGTGRRRTPFAMLHPRVHTGTEVLLFVASL